ncbi:hypothetical protein [Marinobacter mobilis]|uniref:hypothetical protein n=1 Tax=Marinobacter mobilis TaxID=488533 RepID=UPI0035C6C1F0
MPNNSDSKAVEPQSSVPESGTPPRDQEPGSVGGPGQFIDGFFVASVIAVVGLVLLWYPAGTKNLLVLSFIGAIGAGIATLGHAGKKRWRQSGMSLGLVLLLNPWTLLVLEDEGYSNISKSFWRLFSSGPDYAALVAEAESLAGQARRELNQGDYQQGMDTLSEATMSASLGNDITLAKQLLEELISADKKR